MYGGSIGFLVPSGIAFLFVFASSGIEQQLGGLILIMSIAAIASLVGLAISRGEYRSNPKLTRARPYISNQFASNIKQMFSRPISILLSGVFFAFFVSVGFFTFFPLLCAENLGLESHYVGLLMCVGIVSEIVCILFMQTLIRKLGFKGLLIFGLCCTTIRFLSLVIWNDELIVFILSQLLHGPLVISIYILPPIYLNEKSQKHQRHSFISIYQVLCFGLGRLIAPVLLGYVAQTQGLIITFACMTLISALVGLFLYVSFTDSMACRQIESR